MTMEARLWDMAENCGNRSMGGRPKDERDVRSGRCTNTVGQYWQQLKAGKWLLKNREADLPALSQPRLCVKNQRAARQVITLMDINFTPTLQGESRFPADSAADLELE